MSAVIRTLRAYPLIGLTLLVGALGGVLVWSGQPVAARWALSVYVLAFAARRCWYMVAALRRGRYGVDILAVTAIAATVAVAEYWAALVVVLMLATGEALDALASRRAERALRPARACAADRPPALLRHGHRRKLDVPIGSVRRGDQLLVKPARSCPLTRCSSASGAFDESSLTGEPLPVEHLRGERLLAGSVNGSRAVRIRATASAADSQYQRIVDLVRAAQESRAPFVRLADRIAVPFTLLAFAVAGAAWWASGDSTRFAEVLVVATPCPLLIAAPVAFMAGMSRAARHGIIVKEAARSSSSPGCAPRPSTRRAPSPRGCRSLASVRPANDLDSDDLLGMAASVEHFSTHPLASAIVDGARERGLTPAPGADARESTAQGATATVGGHSVVVGKAGFVAEHVHGIPRLALSPGESAVHVGIDGRYAGLLALSDKVRPDARRTLAALHEAGVEHTLMLTGDAEATARHIAEQIGIDDVRAGLLPRTRSPSSRGCPSGRS